MWCSDEVVVVVGGGVSVDSNNHQPKPAFKDGVHVEKKATMQVACLQDTYQTVWFEQFCGEHVKISSIGTGHTHNNSKREKKKKKKLEVIKLQTRA